ncbi:MAG: hypothetical protein V7K62_00910 [Nostoc sp.]
MFLGIAMPGLGYAYASGDSISSKTFGVGVLGMRSLLNYDFFSGYH